MAGWFQNRKVFFFLSIGDTLIWMRPKQILGSSLSHEFLRMYEKFKKIYYIQLRKFCQREIQILLNYLQPLTLKRNYNLRYLGIQDMEVYTFCVPLSLVGPTLSYISDMLNCY